MAKQEETGIKLTLSPSVGAGTYSNLAIISHTPTEFVVDFAQLMPGNQSADATVQQRIILAPVHAKRLMAALSDNIRKYEENYGVIDMMTGNPDAKRNGTLPFPELDPHGKA